jgi:hypothetical protein
MSLAAQRWFSLHRRSHCGHFIVSPVMHFSRRGDAPTTRPAHRAYCYAPRIIPCAPTPAHLTLCPISETPVSFTNTIEGHARGVIASPHGKTDGGSVGRGKHRRDRGVWRSLHGDRWN